MVEVVFVLRGEEVDVEAHANRVERAILEQVRHSLRVRLAGVTCEEHQQAPRITASGPRADALQFDLAGCCQSLIDRTVAALG